MSFKVALCLLLALVGATVANLGGIGHGLGHEHGYHHPKPYDFGYGVVDPYTGNDFGHSEVSDGSGGVQGKYFVLLPDGRRQVVQYTADHIHGYQAHVSYEGAAQYPQHGLGGGHGGHGGHF